MRKEIEEFIETEIRPALNKDGGDIRLDQLQDGELYMLLEGECKHCPAANETIEKFIKKKLFAKFPALTEVKVSSQVDPDLIDEALKILDEKGGCKS